MLACYSIEEAVAAVHQIPTIHREQCREIFEQRFTSHVMAKNYYRLYEHICRSRYAA